MGRSPHHWQANYTTQARRVCISVSVRMEIIVVAEPVVYGGHEVPAAVVQ